MDGSTSVYKVIPWVFSIRNWHLLLRNKKVFIQNVTALDNSPDHPRTVMEMKMRLMLVCVPADAASILKHMDQVIIFNLKCYYWSNTFPKGIAAIDSDYSMAKSIKNFGKAFTILSSVQSLSCVQLFMTLRTTACQASLSITNSQSLLKLISMESVTPSNHLILCCTPLLMPSIFPSIRVLSNESTLCITWRKYCSFSFNISPSNEYPGLISFRMDWFISLQSKGLSRVFSNTTLQKHQFFSAKLSL